MNAEVVAVAANATNILVPESLKITNFCLLTLAAKMTDDTLETVAFVSVPVAGGVGNVVVGDVMNSPILL